jgi:hypothetical protein
MDMRRIRSATILYIEPKRIADWDDAMLKSPQNFSPKFYSMRLIRVLFLSKEPLGENAISIIKKNIAEYPELSGEVKKMFPDFFE